MIKSKKLLAQIKETRAEKARQEAHLTELQREGPNGVRADSNAEGTTIQHWDDSLKTHVKAND